jgi:hypothetical protein
MFSADSPGSFGDGPSGDGPAGDDPVDERGRTAYSVSQERMHSQRREARPELLAKVLEQESLARSLCTECKMQPVSVWCRHEMCSGAAYLCAQCDQKAHMGAPEGGWCYEPIVRRTLSHHRCVWTGSWVPLPRNCLVVMSGSQAEVQSCNLGLWPDIPCRVCGGENWRRNYAGEGPDVLCFTASGLLSFSACKFTCGACDQAQGQRGVLDQACTADCNAGFFASFTGLASSPVVWADKNLLASLLCLVRCCVAAV